MPVKPENAHRYPPDWPQVSLAVRERAGWRCQHPGCRAVQYAVGRWVIVTGRKLVPRFGTPVELEWLWMPLAGNGPCDAAGQGRSWPDMLRWTYKEARQFAAELDWSNGEEGAKPIVIVLTVAHLNHTPEDCRPENLAALCQRHHLAYDAQHHRKTAQTTRLARSGNLELFQ